MESVTKELLATITAGSPVFAIQFHEEPVRHHTTEGELAIALFNTEDLAVTFYSQEMRRDDRLYVTAIRPEEMVGWLENAIGSYGVTRIFYNPDPVRDLGNYRTTLAIAVRDFLSLRKTLDQDGS